MAFRSSLLSSSSASTVLAVLDPTPTLRLEKLLLVNRALLPPAAPAPSSNTAAALPAEPPARCCCCCTNSEARCSWEHSCTALLRCCWRLGGSAAPAHTATAYTTAKTTGYNLPILPQPQHTRTHLLGVNMPQVRTSTKSGSTHCIPWHLWKQFRHQTLAEEFHLLCHGDRHPTSQDRCTDKAGQPLATSLVGTWRQDTSMIKHAQHNVKQNSNSNPNLTHRSLT
jgi:hypothetical protein